MLPKNINPRHILSKSKPIIYNIACPHPPLLLFQHYWEKHPGAQAPTHIVFAWTSQPTRLEFPERNLIFVRSAGIHFLRYFVYFWVREFQNLKYACTPFATPRFRKGIKNSHLRKTFFFSCESFSAAAVGNRRFPIFLRERFISQTFLKGGQSLFFGGARHQITREFPCSYKMLSLPKLDERKGEKKTYICFEFKVLLLVPWACWKGSWKSTYTKYIRRPICYESNFYASTLKKPEKENKIEWHSFFPESSAYILYVETETRKCLLFHKLSPCLSNTFHLSLPTCRTEHQKRERERREREREVGEKEFLYALSQYQ